MSDICVVCAMQVRPRQHGVMCDSCQKWQHRTCETGWHNRLNRKAGGMSLSFYRLVPALQSEAEAVNYELRHIKDGVSTRRICPALQTVEKKIKELWEKYAAGTIATSVLLEGCAAAYGPQFEK